MSPSWEEEASCVCVGTSRSWSGTERDETDRTRMRDSPHTPQETPSLASPETVAYCCAIHRRLESLDSAGFWVDSGLSLPARADYDVRTDVMP